MRRTSHHQHLFNIVTLKQKFGFMFLPVVLLMFAVSPVHAQRSLAGEPEIRQALDRLETLGSIMFIAAHPDDEDSAIIAYCSRGLHMRTAYLSLTRGEGGQNLIGSEQGDELGIIRSQELLAARRIDGAEQYFTRAVDFGFSKTAAETFTKWPREKVLGDIVWNIRRFRPDVVVLNFTGTPRDGHGQHQVSAILGKEAFSAAADPARFPEQLKWVQPWQAKRLMGREPLRRNPNAPNQPPSSQPPAKPNPGKEANAPEYKVEVDVGAYNPDLGYSYQEIRGMGRSLHRSQGQGSPEPKGSLKTGYAVLAGDKDIKGIFDGIDTSWNRVAGGAQVRDVLDKALASFSALHPEQLLPLLAQARPLIAAIEDPLAKRKLVELDETMALCAGMWLEASADQYEVTPGGNLKVNVTAVVRLPAQVTLTGVKLSGMDGAPAPDLAPTVLSFNKPSQYPVTVHVPDGQQYSQPYWLELPKDGWLYSVPNPQMIGLPENPPVMEAHFRLSVAGADIEIARPVDHRYVDRIYGEQRRPLAVVPPVGLELAQRAIVFPGKEPRRIEIAVKANVAHATGETHLEVPAGWQVTPASRHFDLPAAEQQTTVAFDVTPSSAAAGGELRAVAIVDGRAVSSSTEVIQYPHFPFQTLFPPAETALVRADIRTLAKNVGYVMGAGDQVPEALRQMGCQVTLLSADDLTRGDLSRFDAIVTGVRAWNVRADLRANSQRLLDYVSNGGDLVVQYNTATSMADRAMLDGAHMGPYPIHNGGDRVTVEEAPVAFPNPQLPLLHKPNQITSADFDGWVQERGLYFPDKWDPHYQSVLESHDPGEDPKPGGMLYTRYGKGAYIFSAYDWFRELPAGVPGAYRMFANMMSAAKTQ